VAVSNELIKFFSPLAFSLRIRANLKGGLATSSPPYSLPPSGLTDRGIF
jgi:hypothetical protein